MPFKDRERAREYQREYSATHPLSKEQRQKNNAAHRARRAENPEEVRRIERERKRKQYAANPKKFREEARARRMAHPERHRAQGRASRARHPNSARGTFLKANYGITFEEYNEMVTAQGGRCAICGEIPSGDRPVLNVDHNHDTAKIRGLICGLCNRMLGFARNNPGLLQRAICYLTSTEVK